MKEKTKKTISVASWILLVVGAINWGLVGFFGYNLVTSFLGQTATMIVYLLVGLASLVVGYKWISEGHDAKNTIEMIAGWLVIIGGLNWGLVAFGFNLVEWTATFFGLAVLSTIVYALVGVSGVVQGYRSFKEVTK